MLYDLHRSKQNVMNGTNEMLKSTMNVSSLTYLTKQNNLGTVVPPAERNNKTEWEW